MPIYPDGSDSGVKVPAWFDILKDAMRHEGLPDLAGGNGNGHYHLTEEELAKLRGMPSEGMKGDKGDKGETGAQGPKGDPGEKGSKGDTGSKGDKGDKGDTGNPGPKGDTGSKGDKGDKGDTGEKGRAFTYEDFTQEQLAGLKGEKGDTGAAGAKGDKGDAFTYDDFTPAQLEGLRGPQGIQGIPGPQGPKGEDGVTVNYDISDEEVAECLTTTDSEYLYAITDREGRILSTIDRDGNIELTGNVEAKAVTAGNAEILPMDTENVLAIADKSGRKLAVISSDGNIEISGNAEISGAIEAKTITAGSAEISSSEIHSEESEYLLAVTGSNGRMIATLDKSGKIEAHGGISAGNAEISPSATEYLLAITDKAGKVIAGIDEAGNVTAGNASAASIEDPEYIFTLMDKSGKLLQTVDTDGNITFHAPVKGISGSGGGNGSDWSNATSIAIPEPRCAIVNFTGIDAMPATKTQELDAVMEFWDMAGNYFRKNITCAAQGNSSLGFIKKNVKFDLLNEDGTEFTMKIGDWIPQDGFHLKAYYTDYFRGVGAASYKLWDEIMRFNGIEADRPWKKALHVTEGVTPTGGTLSGNDLQLDNGALNHPDCFPCIVYLNGVFYGIFSWQIKKHRDNYHQSKSKVKHIHLDGTLNAANFWDGSIDWTTFEIRNPNKLYTMDGGKYDGDDPKELIDSTSANYDPLNSDHVRSATVKSYIQDLANNFMEVKSLYAGGYVAEAKAKYDEVFDMENQRDYMIFGDITHNYDGFSKNWQWVTYDGVKWWVNAYDLDCMFGGDWQGRKIYSPRTGHITATLNTPSGYIIVLYQSELEARYRELRKGGIIDAGHITALLDGWTKRIGTGNYDLEYEKWPNSPCIVNYTDSIYRVKKWVEKEISYMDTTYNYSN